MRLGLILSVLILCVALVASAETSTATTSKQDLCLKDEQCRRHYANARDLSKAGKLIAAVAEYEAAYAEIQIPVFLYNLGRLHHRLGNLPQAISYYRRFLDAALEDDQEQQARAREYLKELEPSPPTRLEPPPLTPLPPSPVEHPIAEKKPVYKKWWFWTILGTVAVGTAVGVGLGIGLGTGANSNSTPTEPPDLTGLPEVVLVF